MRADLLVLGSRGLGMVKRYTPTAMAFHIELPLLTDRFSHVSGCAKSIMFL
jgi:hypothetical protein